MVFGIGYDDNIQDALCILHEIVRSHELVLKDPEPVVKLYELADSSVNFMVRPWATPADHWTASFQGVFKGSDPLKNGEGTLQCSIFAGTNGLSHTNAVYSSPEGEGFKDPLSGTIKLLKDMRM